MEYKRYRGRKLRHFISFPFIASIIIPLVLIDLWTEIYHRVCFKLYKIPYINRSEYIKIDRHKLPYLSWFSKIACAYCGYANGLAAYLVAVAGATEKYWCGIKHQKLKNFHQPYHHQNFLEYGNQQQFEEYTKNKSYPD